VPRGSRVFPTNRGIQIPTRLGSRLRGEGGVTSGCLSTPLRLRAKEVLLGTQPRSSRLGTGPTHDLSPNSHGRTWTHLTSKCSAELSQPPFDQTTLVSVYFWVEPECPLSRSPLLGSHYCIPPPSLPSSYFLFCCCLITLGTFCPWDQRTQKENSPMVDPLEWLGRPQHCPCHLGTWHLHPF